MMQLAECLHDGLQHGSLHIVFILAYNASFPALIDSRLGPSCYVSPIVDKCRAVITAAGGATTQEPWMCGPHSEALSEGDHTRPVATDLQVL